MCVVSFFLGQANAPATTIGPFIGTGDNQSKKGSTHIDKGPAHKQHWNAITMQINEATIKENTMKIMQSVHVPSL